MGYDRTPTLHIHLNPQQIKHQHLGFWNMDFWELTNEVTAGFSGQLFGPAPTYLTQESIYDYFPDKNWAYKV